MKVKQIRKAAERWYRCVNMEYKNMWKIGSIFWVTILSTTFYDWGLYTESNGDEALSEKFIFKSNGDEALNDVFP